MCSGTVRLLSETDRIFVPTDRLLTRTVRLFVLTDRFPSKTDRLLDLIVFSILMER
ncbi:hypothetical protein [Psychrobacillus sp. MER TA 171]|uniref:hypothetical protein n=1 Tax=Psychrobacillus sp. MER TA 171 TaxID=2939577 RepID=UPI002041950E|nr:hypothetical protein [Psychrobacillus sp. MER TA 171]